MTWTVFYAWQSDSPGNTNRNLIEQALKDAIDEIRSDGHLEIDPRLDKDTIGVAGAPDITATIFEKIETSAVFVADVTIVTSPGSARAIPNPNVLVELGYAIRALGSKRVVLVMNTRFGGPDALPFDIRQKRVLAYDVPEDAPQKAPERRRLQATLVEALRLGLAEAEVARPKVPSAPTAADALITSMQARSPTQRSAARKFVAEILGEIDRGAPTNPRDDDSLVAALEAGKSMVSRFWRVVETFVVYRDDAVKEELLRGFEQLLRRYDFPAGVGGAYRNTDFDYFKFLGHELFVLLIAGYIREEAWAPLGSVLSEPLHVTGSSRPDRTVFADELSEYTGLLDEDRARRLGAGGATRISIRADMLKARYSEGDLATDVGWPLFSSADLFLALRFSHVVNPYAFWRPWTALFIKDLPDYLLRASARSNAAKLATALGVPDVDAARTRVTSSLNALIGLYPNSTWRPPGRGHDWRKFGTT